MTLSICALLVGCSSSGDKEKLNDDRPVEEIYNEAATALDTGRNKIAAQLFEEVERQYPFSEWAIRAEMIALG